MGGQHLAHELQKLGRTRRRVYGSWQGVHLVLYGPHEQVSETFVGEARALQGALNVIPFGNHPSEFFVQRFYAFGGGGVSFALALQSPFQVGATTL